MDDRDRIILQKIIKYAVEVRETITRFELDYFKFKSDHVMKNAIAMCLLQIGELSGKLSDEFKEKHNEMPWRDITAVRNRAAHAYDTVDMEIVWNTVTINIPQLETYCESILNQEA